MKPYYDHAGIQIFHGDCREVLPGLPDCSVQCCVTSPPYWGLRSYGVGTENGEIGLEPTPEEYVATMVEVFREVRRVLRDDGTLWLNLGDTYASSGGERTYGSSDNVTGRGPGTRRHDVPASGLKPKDLCGIPWRVAFALQADGWHLRQDIIWHKPNPMPESVTDRCTKAHEYIFLMSKKPRYYYDAEAIKEDGVDPESYAGRNKRNPDAFTQAGKRSQYRDGFAKLEGQKCLTRNKRSVWTVTTKPFKEAHFATFPPDLIKPCILAGCPEGGVVLDPFGGSGTTAAAAKYHLRKAVSIELNEEYLPMQKNRLAQEVLPFT